jgi:hypothetical protein
MSIASEIERIQNAKASIKTAIESKGVEVGEGTIDTYASKIGEITTGGGGDNWYDTFWDTYQQNGNRTNYSYGFYSSGWTKDNFKPKYDIKPTDASYMLNGASLYIDLVEHLKTLDIILDFSNCTNFSWMIYGCRLSRIGVVDMRKVSSAANANNVFRQGGADTLETIDKVIVSEKYPLGSNSFTNCTKLKNITIEGDITGNFSIASSSLLTDDSIDSIISHLVDLTGATSKTLSVASSVKTKIQANSTWLATITSKNWTLA